MNKINLYYYLKNIEILHISKLFIKKCIVLLSRPDTL